MSTNPFEAPETDPSPRDARDLGILAPYVGVIDTVGRAFRVYFGNIALIAGITLAVFLPVEIAKNLFFSATGSGEDVGTVMRVEMMIESIFGSLVSAAVIFALARKLEMGHTLGVGEALSNGMKRWGAVFGARFFSGLYILLGVLLLIVPAIMWMVKFALTDEIATLERRFDAKSVLDASKELVSGHGWDVVGIGLVVGFAGMSVQFALGFASAFSEAWPVQVVFDCANDVVYRFFTVTFLVVYFAFKAEKAAASV